AMGCLCVVSDNPALMENVIHQETGWVVPRRNAHALANTVRQIIQLNESEKQAIRQKAIARVQEQFNLLVQKQQFIRFYEEN
ncbi:MAG: glycosyltransferase, partial [Chitinophagaceae bacterium]|nr:glycosyltransferase [Chitinophagaceae bacterium]